MSYRTSTSRALFDRPLRVMVEGGSSPSRGPANYGDFPIFIERGRGTRVYDADGNEYIDWMMAYGALPLGHAHPRIVDAVTQAMAGGTLVAAATEIEIEVAELIQQMGPPPSASASPIPAPRPRWRPSAWRVVTRASRSSSSSRGTITAGMTTSSSMHTRHPVVSLGHRRDPIKIADSSGLNRRALDDTIVVPWE